MGERIKQTRGKSWSLQELQIIDENRSLTAEQLALLLPSRTAIGIAKKRAERHGRRISRASDRGCWSVQDELICKAWNHAFDMMRNTRKGEG